MTKLGLPCTRQHIRVCCCQRWNRVKQFAPWPNPTRWQLTRRPDPDKLKCVQCPTIGLIIGIHNCMIFSWRPWWSWKFSSDNTSIGLPVQRAVLIKIFLRSCKRLMCHVLRSALLGLIVIDQVFLTAWATSSDDRWELTRLVPWLDLACRRETALRLRRWRANFTRFNSSWDWRLFCSHQASRSNTFLSSRPVVL